jgi:hypothetical protein
MSTDDPVTTVWRVGTCGPLKVAEFPGLPFGNLEIGDKIDLPGQGLARCYGKSTLGSILPPFDQTVIELNLLLLY